MNSITIQGYKSFRDITIPLRPINILVGSNGCGKSNFLSLLELLGYAYKGCLARGVELSGGVDKILHKGGKVTDKISINLTKGSNSYVLDLKATQGALVVETEKLGYESAKGEWTYDCISTNEPEPRLRLYHGRTAAEHFKEYMSQLRKYHFHQEGPKNPFPEESHIENDSYSLNSDGTNIATLIHDIKNQEPLVYRHMIHIIQSVAPFFQDFFLEPNEYGNLSLKWKDKYSDLLYGPNELSDGTIRFIALTVLFMQPKAPKVIVIDEPELGLHPFAIDKLAGLIRSAANRGAQIIAATQNAELISNFQPEDILTVDLHEGESYIKRLNADELKLWPEDNSLGDLWKQRIISGGQPF